MKTALHIGMGVVLLGMLLTIRAQANVIQPDSVSGLQLWYDATDSSYVTTDSEGIVLKNKAGVSGVADATVTVGSPTLVGNAVNGLSAVYFDGGDGMKGATTQSLFGVYGSTFTGAGTVFTVFVPTAVDSTREWVVQIDRNGGGSSLITLGADAAIGGGGFNASQGSGGVAFRVAESGAVLDGVTNGNSTSTMVQGETYVAAYGFDNAANEGDGKMFGVFTTTAYNDPIDLGTLSDQLSYSGVDSNARINLGYNPGFTSGDFKMTGYLAETLVYNAALTPNEIIGVTEYLADKYGVTTVPEPGSWALLFTGLLALTIRRYRRER